MDQIAYIKNGIEELYNTNPRIHITVRQTRPKVVVENASVTIVGVYRNIFQIEENDRGRPCRHTFQYGDVLIGQVQIEELHYTPPTVAKRK